MLFTWPGTWPWVGSYGTHGIFGGSVADIARMGLGKLIWGILTTWG